MSELETRPLDPEADQRELIALFEQVFGFSVTPAMWRWKYLPEWTQRHYCWVGIYEGELIGFFGAVPLRGLVDGEEVPYFQLADAMVHPEHRRRFDYFELSTRYILEEIVRVHPRRIIYGFTNHVAFLWFKRLGLGDLVEKARVCFARPGQGLSPADYEFRPWSWDEEVLEGLWRAQRSSIGAGLVRDGSYLRWRYGGHPFNRYRLLGVLRGGEPLGWAVLGQAGKRVEVPVVDLFVPREDPRAVLAALSDHLERPLRTWLASAASSPFEEEKETKTNVYLFTKESTLGVEQLRRQLYYTMGDADWW